MNGTELKLRRIAAHVKSKALAEAAGWPPYKISRIETRAWVEADEVDRYVAALATLTTTTTETAGAA